MRIFSLLIISFLGFANGQDFQAIYPNSIAHFGEHNYPLQIVNTTQNGDTIFYHGFSMIRSVQYQLKLNGNHWTGEKIGVLPEGNYIFYNKNHQEIRIKSQANLEDTWRVFDFENGNYVVAQVSQWQPEDFIGITEDVKTISLQLRNADGENIESPLNDMSLKISENHGFVKLLNFYEFPFTENTYSLYPFQEEMDLVGFDELGYQPFGAKEIFGFEVGDVFHQYEYFWEFDSSEAIGQLEKKDIKTILGKEIQTDENMITYEIENCGYLIINYQDESEWNGTITVTYDFNLPEFQQLSQYNFKPYYNPDTEKYVVTYAKGNNKRILYEFTGSEENLDTEYYNEPFFSGENDPNQYENLYIKQLGGPFHSHLLMCCIDENHLQYYSVEGETYGSPFDFNCSGNSATQDVSSLFNPVKIYPNPARDVLNIKAQGVYPESFTIYNMSGKVIKNFLNDENMNQINIADIPNGTYLLQIQTKDTIYGMRFIKK